MALSTFAESLEFATVDDVEGWTSSDRLDAVHIVSFALDADLGKFVGRSNNNPIREIFLARAIHKDFVWLDETDCEMRPCQQDSHASATP